MPEGPSIVIAAEAIRVFKGKKVLSATGSAKIDMEALAGKKLIDIRTWGKHLLLCFKGVTIRVHFLMFGTYYINDTKDLPPRLSLQFARNKELNIYTSSIVAIEDALDEVYDWQADLLSDQWNAAQARKKLKKIPGTLVTDALLDQTIFAGCGNIIKNEVLYRIRVHPATRLGELPPRKLTEMINEARNYSFDFLKWKKEGVLKRNWLVYTKKTCGRDGTAIKKEYLGEGKRRTFYCDTCQVHY